MVPEPSEIDALRTACAAAERRTAAAEAQAAEAARERAVLASAEATIAALRGRRGEAGEDAGAAVMDGAELAVHDLVGADDLAAEGLADGLVAEADADERRAGLGGGLDEREADAGVVGGAGAGGEEDGRGAHRHRLLDVDLVVAADLGLGAEFPEIVEEVPGVAVVVVDVAAARGRSRRAAGAGRARPAGLRVRAGAGDDRLDAGAGAGDAESCRRPGLGERADPAD